MTHALNPLNVGDRVEIALPWRDGERVWATITSIENGWLRFDGDPNILMAKVDKVLAVEQANRD